MHQHTPVRVALVAPREEDHALVAALLAQAPGVRCLVTGTRDRLAAGPALAGDKHDICLLDHALATGPDSLLPTALAAGRPVIVLADTDDPRTEERMLAAGAWDCLARSQLTPQLLGKIVRLALHHAPVGDRRAVNAALRRSEERYRALFESSLAAVWVSSADGRMLDCNESFARIFGYDSREEALSQPTSAFHATADEQAEFSRLVRNAGRLVNFESRGRRRDGTPIWLLENVTVLEQPAGAPTVFQGTSIDITERKWAEENLRRTLSLLAATLEATVNGILVVDRQRKVVTWNRRFAEIWGLPEDLGTSSDEELLALVGRQLVSPEEFLENVEDLYAQPETEDLRILRLRDGRIIERSSLPQRVGNEVVGRVWSFQDVTGHKQSEEALRRSEARYRSLVRHAVHGIVQTTLDGVILEANLAFATMLGYGSEEELLNADLRRFFIRHAERLHLIEAYAHGDRLRPMEVDWQRKDGTLITARLSGVAVADFDGTVRSFELIAEDVTEHRLLESQFRQAQKMEAIGRLAGGVAHDFNNLLTAMLGYSEMLRDSLAADDPRRRDVDEIYRAAERASALTRQLLTFSRKQVLQPRVLSLNAVVSGFDKMLRRLIGEDVALVTVLGDALGQVRGDPGQIEQVIMNLAVNARDAMPEGGRLTIETANVELDHAYARTHTSVAPGSYVMLAISDTGTGMTAEVKSHLFEPFFTTKERGKGSGLGLATVYGIVQQSGGHIWVYSEPGQGTTFKVYLPRITEPAANEAEAARSAVLPRGNETVLLVEDEAAVRALARDVLERQGYEVFVAPDGQEAVSIAASRDGRIDLLVTDVVMPGMSGRDVARSLSLLRPGLRVLYMSGYTDHAVVDHGILDPGVPFLQKPFTPDALARAVRGALDGADTPR